jgi:hypothetical protein
VWPLGSGWEMPKEAAAGSSQGGLVSLKYTFRYKNQFDEPNDDSLDCIEATSDELLGAYTRAEDDAMTLAFGGWDKKRLNRVFNVISFVYLDYCYPLRKQGKKRKSAASAIASSPKLKKVKVLTHRPKRSETADVLKPTEGSSTSRSDCPTLAETKGKLAKVPMTKVIMERQKNETADVPKRPVEARAKTAEEPESKKLAEQPKILSPPQEMELPKVLEIPAITPKRRRMASVLDAIMESTKVLTPASAEVPNMGEKNMKGTTEADMSQVGIEVGPSVLAETGLRRLLKRILKQDIQMLQKLAKSLNSLLLKLLLRDWNS